MIEYEKTFSVSFFSFLLQTIGVYHILRLCVHLYRFLPRFVQIEPVRQTHAQSAHAKMPIVMSQCKTLSFSNHEILNMFSLCIFANCIRVLPVEHSMNFCSISFFKAIKCESHTHAQQCERRVNVLLLVYEHCGMQPIYGCHIIFRNEAAACAACEMFGNLILSKRQYTQ